MRESIKEALRTVVNNCDKELRTSAQIEIAKYIAELETLQSNYETQEIIIAELKREIEMMEQDLAGEDI